MSESAGEPEAQGMVLATPSMRCGKSFGSVFSSRGLDSGRLSFTRPQCKVGQARENASQFPHVASRLFTGRKLERQVRTRRQIEHLRTTVPMAYFAATRAAASLGAAAASPQRRDPGEQSGAGSSNRRNGGSLRRRPIPRPPFSGVTRVVPGADRFWQAGCPGTCRPLSLPKRRKATSDHRETGPVRFAVRLVRAREARGPKSRLKVP